jgi:hypothetical protein
MPLPANFDLTPFMKKVPPPPAPGQVWHFESLKQFWHIIGMAAGGDTMAHITYAVYPEGEPGEKPLEIATLRLDAFYEKLHGGAELVGPRGVTWPPPDGRSMGFGR